ncbi:MAG: lamin tail domain-containing protein, partial [Planctomycetota bacterium]
MRSLAVLAATAAVANVPTQNGVMGHGPMAAEQPAKEAVKSFSKRFALEFMAAPVMALPPIDGPGLLLEDEFATKDMPQRFAVQVPVELSLADGQWISVAGGRVWRCDVAGVDSLNARLRLIGVNLGAGQQIFLDDPNSDLGTVGPIEGRGSWDNGEAWGVFTPGAASRIEWFVPEGTTVTALPFTGVEYSHGYRDVFQVMAQAFAAQCHYDPVCYPAWANQSNAAGRMTFTSGGASYLCSGQLMATTAADETPYFSTANHCISTQSEAASLVVQFFYRASTCNGANNAGTAVSGADLVKTYATSDCTLLMLKGTLPASVYWTGWMATNPANGTASVSIHHPGGAEQDISFCSKYATNNYCGTGSNWSEVAWTLGITEGGSSGSALYVESTQQLYGVLTCGDSSCTLTTGHDAYGRWDVAVNAGGFAASLAAGADDALEPNDSCAAAKVLAASTNTGLVLKRVNSDWYAIDVAAGATLTATATFTHAYGDIDFRLWSGCGGTLLVDANGNTNNETVTWTNSGASTATVYLEAYLASNTRNTYGLTVALSGGGGGGGGGGSGSGGVKISQIYGGGGSTTGGPTYNKDYVEIFNSSSSPVNIGGWAIEYGSATGTWGSSTSAIFTFPAGTTIQPC